MKLNSKALYASMLAVMLVNPNVAIAADSNSKASTETNTATTEGLSNLQQNTLGNTSPEHEGYVTGGVTSNESVQLTGADLEDAIQRCGVPDAAQKAKQDAIQMATIGIDIDGIFNSAKEEVQGCFAATQDIINIAVEVPNISNIFGQITRVAQEQANKYIQEQVMQAINKGCEIAQQTVRDTIEPLADFIEKYEQTVDEGYALFGDYESEIRQDGTTYTTGDFLRSMDLELGSPKAGSGSDSTSSGARAASPASSPASSGSQATTNKFNTYSNMF